MGASSARVSPPFQRQALWLATSIRGFMGSSARASWKMSSPPILTARPRLMALTRRPPAAEMTKGLGMALLLVPCILVLWLQQAIVEAHITAEQSQPAAQKQRQKTSYSDHARNQSQSDKAGHQDIAIAGQQSPQQMHTGAAHDVKHIGRDQGAGRRYQQDRQQDEDIEGLKADQAKACLNEVARAAPGFPAPELGFRAQFIAHCKPSPSEAATSTS